MKGIQLNLKKYLVEAIVWSVLWTLFLTPYSILVEQLTILQFFYWVGMEFVLVLPLAPVVNYVGKRIVKKVMK